MISTTLFEFIQKLSKSEKRYVNLQLKKFTHKKKDYAVLYDIMLKMKVYDANVLKTQLEKEKVKGQISNLKRYLYDLILDFLCEFYRRGNFEGQIFHELSRIDILFQKDLKKEGCQRTKKAKQKLDHLRHFHSIRLKLHANCMSCLSKKEMPKEMYRNYFAEQQNILEAIQEENAYFQLKVEFLNKMMVQKNDMLSSRGAKMLKETLQHPLLRAPPNTFKALDAEMIYFRLLHNIYMMLGDVKKSIYYLDKGVEVISPFFDKGIGYIDRMRFTFSSRLLLLRLQQKDFVIFEKQRNDFERANIKPASLKVKHKTLSYFHLLNFKEHEKVSHLLNWSEVKANLKENEGIKNTPTYQNMIFSCINLIAIKQEYEKFIDFFNEFIPTINSPYDKEYYIYCHFICIVVHYELRNWRFLKSLILKTERLISKLKCNTIDKRIIIKFFRKVIQTKLDDIFKEVNVDQECQRLFQKFQLMLSNYDIDYMRKNDVTFDMKQWIGEQAVRTN